MDYDSYRKAYFIEPQPSPKFDFIGLHGVALFFNDYEAAVTYYTTVLGEPAYVEGKYPHGWRIGTIWLTLFPAKSGSPNNTEIHFLVSNIDEVDRLYTAFIEAGGKGDPPSDQLMYEPLCYCSVQDPFGTNILILCRIPNN